jgi:hypothetical protein
MRHTVFKATTVFSISFTHTHTHTNTHEIKSFKHAYAKVLGSWHSWGGRNIRRLALKPDPLIYGHLLNPPACFSDFFSACKTTQELPVTQLARHIDLFHLVITDNRRPETLSLPHGLTPPRKSTTHFQPSCSTLNPKRVMALQSGPINLSFAHVAWS